MKLHEAMRDILLDRPQRTASYAFIAAENERRKLYKRKDGDYPPPGQIAWRASQYEPRGWFKRLEGGKVQFVGKLP